MIGRPLEWEAAPFYAGYIGLVPGEDPVAVLEAQLAEVLALAGTVSEEASLRRYAEGKWSVRQVLNHVTDTERAFVFRALWFGRGFTGPLESFDQHVSVAGAEADRVSWAELVEEFRLVRGATIALFRHMPEAGWRRSGVASGNVVSVRALAFITAGHAAHHLAVLRERYLH